MPYLLAYLLTILILLTILTILTYHTYRIQTICSLAHTNAYLDLSGAMCSYLELSGATQNYLELPGATWSYLRLSGPIYGYLELPGALWRYPELSGADRISFYAILYLLTIPNGDMPYARMSICHMPIWSYARMPTCHTYLLYYAICRIVRYGIKALKCNYAGRGWPDPSPTIIVCSRHMGIRAYEHMGIWHMVRIRRMWSKPLAHK